VRLLDSLIMTVQLSIRKLLQVRAAPKAPGFRLSASACFAPAFGKTI